MPFVFYTYTQVTTQKKESLFRQKLELLLLSESKELPATLRDFISRNHFSHYHLFASDNYEDLPRDYKRPAVIWLQQSESEPISTFSARIDKVLQFFSRASIIAVLAKAENLEGTDSPRIFPLSKTEFLNTSKAEMICLLKARSQFFDIEINDLFPMTAIDFTAYVRLSLNRRYLAVLFKGTVIDEQRLERLRRSSGLLIPMTESQAYRQYIHTYNDTTGLALRKRLRSSFYHLTSSWISLIEKISLEMKTTSEEDIQQLYSQLEEAAGEMAELLKTEEDIWDTLRETCDTAFLKQWRAPWIAAYSGLLATRSELGSPTQAILLGLLADIGWIDINPTTAKKFISRGLDELSEDEKTQLQALPMASLNRALGKKLPLTEELKASLVTTYEKVDQSGFPNQVPADKIPVESYLVAFSRKVDLGVRTTLQETGIGFRFLREKVWEKEKAAADHFPSNFLEKIANALL